MNNRLIILGSLCILLLLCLILFRTQREGFATAATATATTVPTSLEFPPDIPTYLANNATKAVTDAVNTNPTVYENLPTDAGIISAIAAEKAQMEKIETARTFRDNAIQTIRDQLTSKSNAKTKRDLKNTEYESAVSAAKTAIDSGKRTASQAVTAAKARKTAYDNAQSTYDTGASDITTYTTKVANDTAELNAANVAMDAIIANDNEVKKAKRSITRAASGITPASINAALATATTEYNNKLSSLRSTVEYNISAGNNSPDAINKAQELKDLLAKPPTYASVEAEQLAAASDPRLIEILNGKIQAVRDANRNEQTRIVNAQLALQQDSTALSQLNAAQPGKKTERDGAKRAMDDGTSVSSAESAYTTAANKSYTDVQAVKDAKSAYDTAQSEYDAITITDNVTAGTIDNASTVSNANSVLTAEKGKLAPLVTARNTAITTGKTAIDNAIRAAAKREADNAYSADATFMANALAFPNSTFSTDTKYTTLKNDWSAYQGSRTGTDVDALLAAYTKFTTSKGLYGPAVISALRNSTTDANYVNNNEADATTFGVTNKYTPMKTAWTQVQTSLTASNANDAMANYNAYVSKKELFSKALALSKAKAAYDAAVVAKSAADTTWNTEDADYKSIKRSVPETKLAYDNAQLLADTATQQKADYNAALAQLTEANTALRNATNALREANRSANVRVTSTYLADETFMTNTLAFPNDALNTTTSYNAMKTKWDKVKSDREAVNGIDSGKTKEIADATDTLLQSYNAFNTSKSAYGEAVANAISAVTTTNSQYITNNKNDATASGVGAKHDAMVTAWAAVTSNLSKKDASVLVPNYNTYQTAKDSFAAALKAAKKTAYDSAKAVEDTAKATWNTEDADYKSIKRSVAETKLAYDNAQLLADKATQQKADYNAALAQQTAANTALDDAVKALIKANDAANTQVNTSYTADDILMTNANTFPNSAFGTAELYTTMSEKWSKVKSERDALTTARSSNTSSNKAKEIADATDKVLEAYNAFNTSKNAYSDALIPALTEKKATIDDDIVKYQADATKYDLSTQYDTMKTAWNSVTANMEKSKIGTMIKNYNTYKTARETFESAVQSAINERADKRTREAKASNDAWIAASRSGARNLVSASSDMILNQCKDDEYLAGYSKVFDSYQYTCRVIPMGTKGREGATGLPGMDGTPGPAGPDGPKGPQGPEGAPGGKGALGKTSTIPGSKGQIGLDGPKGPMGPVGKAGASAKGYIKQVAGPQGPKGPVGPAGAPGPKGAAGNAEMQPYVLPPEDEILYLLGLRNKVRNYLYG